MTPARTILVVDDAPDCVATLDMALAPLDGVTIVAVPSAESALPWLHEAALAAVITDLQLPEMTGLELIGRIRARRSVPIVVVSASPDPSAPQQALAAGADAFFAKPFSPVAIRKKLEELLHA
jgi:CheY-like chemotaxis protein